MKQHKLKFFALSAAAALLLTGNAWSATDTASAASAQGSPKTMKATDRALAKKVHRALSKTAGLDPTHIYVKARSGVVTLTGSCESQNQIELAGKAAEGVAGVSSMKNELSVKTPN